MASVKPRVTKSGERRWVVRYRDPTGRSRERWFATKTEAVRHGTAEEAKVHEGRWLDPSRGRITLEEWIKEWRGTLVALKPKTRDTYESLLTSRILPAVGHMRLHAIKPSAVKTWMARMEADGLSASRISQAVNLLSRILRAAVHDERIASNPCDGIRRPAPRRAEVDPLTPSEILMLIGTVPSDYRVLVATLAYTGMRFGEACALRWKHVNLMKRQITIAESMSVTSIGVTFGPTKTHSRRVITIPEVLLSHLERHLAGHGAPTPDALVFTTSRGAPVRGSNFTRRVWSTATSQIGRTGLRVHDLRHTCASLLIGGGASLVEVAAHLGHENPTTTLKYYGHLTSGASASVARRLDAIVGYTT